MSIGVVIITHHAKHLLKACLEPLLASPLKILVTNSSSNDGTVELAKELGAEVLLIPRAEFNHGLTRERARKAIGTDIVVMMTPDAILHSPDSLQKLVEPLLEGKASLSYARQLPHKGADFFESYPRTFNYPATSHIRSWEDREKYGIYSIFCSDSCAAYLNSALDEVGGFPEVLLGEDTVVAAKLLKAGHKIAYVAESLVHHSHRYTLLQEFRRNFDTGYARKLQRELFQPFGRDEKRGTTFFFAFIAHLWKNKPHLIPYATLQTAFKYGGYLLGRRAHKAPLRIKKICSSQDYYWNDR